MANPVPPGWEDILDPGEEIRWQGQPVPTFDWSSLMQTRTLNGLFTAVFAVFWIAMALWITGKTTGPGGFGALEGPPAFFRWVFPLFGLPVLFGGLNRAFGQPIRDWLRLKNSFYTLTDRNAFIAQSTAGKRALIRLPLGPGLMPALEEGDPGTIWLGDPPAPKGGWQGKGSAASYFGLASEPARNGFERIREARRVYRMILDTPPPPPAASGAP